MTPPSPVVTFLIGCSEKTAVPVSPTLESRQAEPSACAASSTRWASHPAATRRRSSRSSAAPAKCTGTIRRVRAVTHRFTSRAFVIRVSRSTSANTGVAPRSTTRLTVETHVSDGVITSSPGPIPRACNSTCMPAVAEDTATACRQPVARANAASRSATRGPVVSHPDRNTPVTAAMSSCVSDGLHSGRKGSSIRGSNITWPLATATHIGWRSHGGATCARTTAHPMSGVSVGGAA